MPSCTCLYRDGTSGYNRDKIVQNILMVTLSCGVSFPFDIIKWLKLDRNTCTIEMSHKGTSLVYACC